MYDSREFRGWDLYTPELVRLWATDPVKATKVCLNIYRAGMRLWQESVDQWWTLAGLSFEALKRGSAGMNDNPDRE